MSKKLVQIGRREHRIVYESEGDIPLLDMELPRPIESLHQIEITSRCNLRCVYCPSPNLGRPKVDMSEDHFMRAMEWVSYLVKRGTQIELNLAGIGESTLHPDFVRFVAIARETVGPDIAVTLATNGITMTEELARKLAPSRPSLWVSLHRPEKAGPAIQILKKHGLYIGSSSHPATEGNSWAGQVEWEDTQTFSSACQWIRNGFAMAMADGRVTSCCIDASGSGVIGHLDDAVPTVKTRPYNLCKTCHQHIRIKGVNQRGT